MSWRTDVGKIQYPKGTSAKSRRHCRSIIQSLSERLDVAQLIVVAASGGLDSTVLCHALGQALRIRPENNAKQVVEATACYVNHNLRAKENKLEVEQVARLNATCLTLFTAPQEATVDTGANLQDRARGLRYEALKNVCRNYVTAKNLPAHSVRLWTAHSANDQAETRLYQFIKGYKPNGITRWAKVAGEPAFFLERPLLDFERSDIEKYADVFKLVWCEDSSNVTDKYARNRIRHHLVPWIQQHVNPGVVKSLTCS